MTMQLVHVMEPPEPGDDRSPGAVLRNENGAMLIVGIFMVMFIAAMLYYVVGIGDTVTYRERMQDAADAGAMTGAIFMARGMNIITLIQTSQFKQPKLMCQQPHQSSFIITPNIKEPEPRIS